MVVYLHEALGHTLQSGKTLTNSDVDEAALEGDVHRLRPKLMTVCAMLASLVPILWQSGIGSDVMKPIAAPIVFLLPQPQSNSEPGSSPHPGCPLLRLSAIP
jgi:Cu(I)/Ag(I) efflux system membrane protein CusA/SilA